MVAEQNTATPTRAPGTKVDAMAAGRGASQGVGRGSGRAPMWTPPSSSEGVTPTPTSGTGSGPLEGVEGTPGAGSNSSVGSIPTKEREFQRVKERLVHFNEHIRSKLKETHAALQKEKEEREAQLPQLSELIQDKTSTIAGAVGVELT